MNLKVILMAVGAFVVGLGGSTAAIVMRAPGPPANAKHPGADSTASHAPAVPGQTPDAHAESTATRPTPTPAPTPLNTADAGKPSTGGSAAATAPPPPAGATGTPGTASAAIAAAANATGVVVASAESAAGYRQVARVLSSMKPADAAKIVAFLSDDQLEGILSQLGVRQSASLMSELPTERAAALSRRIMKHTPEAK